MTMRISVAIRNAMLDAARTSANAGKLRIYSGARPADANTALSGNTLLAELTLNATAFPAASGGVLTANAITAGVAAASGAASFARVFQSDGTTALWDLSVGVGTGEVQMPTLTVTALITITCSALTVTLPVGA